MTKIGLEKTAKIRNISKNELNQAERLQNKSIDELKATAGLRIIKNSDKLTLVPLKLLHAIAPAVVITVTSVNLLSCQMCTF